MIDNVQTIEVGKLYFYEGEHVNFYFVALFVEKLAEFICVKVLTTYKVNNTNKKAFKVKFLYLREYHKYDISLIE